jgi:hypothetical protein
VYSYGSEEKKRLTLKQIKQLMGSGLGIYSLYTLFNDDIHDVPSKVSLLVAIAGAGYLYSHINQIRSFDAK